MNDLVVTAVLVGLAWWCYEYWWPRPRQHPSGRRSRRRNKNSRSR